MSEPHRFPPQTVLRMFYAAMAAAVLIFAPIGVLLSGTSNETEQYRREMRAAVADMRESVAEIEARLQACAIYPYVLLPSP